MAQTIPLGLHTEPAEQPVSVSRASTVSWFVWSGVLAVSSIAFGLYWDISWHMTIGRDTFWTPAHLAIHFGGILAAITCIVLIFLTTFSHDPASQSASVRVWGFLGPLGAHGFFASPSVRTLSNVHLRFASRSRWNRCP
jgi:hypothetical protein